MTAFDELQSCFALADAAVAGEQDALTVDLHQHAVGRQARGEIVVQGHDDPRLEIGGVLIGAQDVAVILLGHLEAFLRGLHAVAEHQRGDIVGHKALVSGEAIFVGEGVQVGALDVADDLQPLGVEVIIEAGELQGGAVHVGGGEDGLVIIAGRVQHGQAALLDNGFKLDRIFASHSWFLPVVIVRISPSIIPVFYPPRNSFLHAAGRRKAAKSPARYFMREAGVK